VGIGLLPCKVGLDIYSFVTMRMYQKKQSNKDINNIMKKLKIDER